MGRDTSDDNSAIVTIADGIAAMDPAVEDRADADATVRLLDQERSAPRRREFRGDLPGLAKRVSPV